MGIIVRQENSGTVFKVYQSKNDFNSEKQSFLIEDNLKDFRLQKTFKKKTSAKERKALEEAGKIIFEDYNCYFELYANGSGDNIVIEKIQIETKYKLDEIQIKSIAINKDILFDVFFNKKSNLEIDTLKQEFGFDEYDLLIAVVGTFGYGKTTLIKKLLKLPDKYVFPLVDNGRTTISPSVLRGILVYEEEGKKYIINHETISNQQTGNIQIKRIPLNEYKFKNIIYLEEFDFIYYNTIEPNLQNAFKVYCKNKNVKETLTKFIANDKCSLDELLGDIEEYKSNEFYSIVINTFEKIYNELKEDKDEINIDFTQDKIILDAFKEYCKNKVQEVVCNINEKTSREDITVMGNVIKFDLAANQIKDFNKYYEHFSSNKTEIRGKGLRILVKKTYTEVDFDILKFKDAQKNIVNLSKNIFDENNYYKYDSFAFVDTMGCSHVHKNKENDSKMDNDIINNSALLNESDIVLLLENSSKTMGKDICAQLFTLESLGYRHKIILCYSYYNQFIKGDMKSDEEREDVLKESLENALKDLYPKNHNKAERIFNDFTKDNRQIVYLKGLVPRKDAKVDEHDDDDERECSDENAISSAEAENKKAYILNYGIENSRACLVELIEKIVILNQYAKQQNSNTFSIEENSRDEIFTINYSQKMYPSFLDNYLNKEYDIYKIKVPAHNTSAALCRNAYLGNAYFDGAMVLEPLNDAMAEIVFRFSEFIENDFCLTLVQDDDGTAIDKSLNKDFLIDKIKSCFNEKVKEYFQRILVSTQKTKWSSIAIDSGSGVKHRRSSDIYKLIHDTYTMSSLVQDILGYIRESIDEVVDAYGIR